jgi:hypothetical protein
VSYFLIFSSVLCAWAMLRMMGSERSLRIREIEARVKKAAEPPPPPSNEPIAVGGPAPATPPAQPTQPKPAAAKPPQKPAAKAPAASSKQKH